GPPEPNEWKCEVQWQDGKNSITPDPGSVEGTARQPCLYFFPLGERCPIQRGRVTAQSSQLAALARIVSHFMVSFSIRSSRIRYPVPTSSLTVIVPCGETATS